jgi:hypothetical protein
MCSFRVFAPLVRSAREGRKPFLVLGKAHEDSCRYCMIVRDRRRELEGRWANNGGWMATGFGIAGIFSVGRG